MTQRADDVIWAWRHPRPERVEGYCIGRTDAAVDPRRARRLARRIQRVARANHLSHEIWTSPLHRCADVGRWLRRWGWVHRIDAALIEMDFGAWDGKPWSAIARQEMEAWNQDFSGYAPGGGESLTAVLARAASWRVAGVKLVVAHAGWMRARRSNESASALPVTAAAFPAGPAYGVLWKLQGTAPAQS